MNKEIMIRKVKKHLDFVDANKDLVGLSDWRVKFNCKEEAQGDMLARVEADIYEQELTVYLSNAFMKKDALVQQNILLHELIHARVLVYHIQSNKACELLEEQMVNDLTRGFDKLRLLR